MMLRLKHEDRITDEDGASENDVQAFTEDVLSAMTEAQMLEINGKHGAIRKALLLTFDQQMSPSVRRLIRIALGHAEEASHLSAAVLGSTRGA